MKPEVAAGKQGCVAESDLIGSDRSSALFCFSVVAAREKRHGGLAEKDLPLESCQSASDRDRFPPLGLSCE